MWVQVALFIASLVISYLMQPKPPKAKPSAFEDFQFPTIEDGTPKMVVFGDVWITDWCVIGAGNYRTSPIIKKQKGMFGSKKQTVGHRYMMSLHMGLCMTMDELVEIKVGDRSAWGRHTKNEKPIFRGFFANRNYTNLAIPVNDIYLASENQSRLRIYQPNLFNGEEGEGGIDGVLIIMKGASDQMPLPELQRMHKSPVPAYRGVVTFFFDGIVCANSPYPKAWSFRVRRTTCDWYNEKSTIWLDDGQGNQIKAMNPAHIIFEAQTNEDWGRGTDIRQLDLESFKQCADILYDEKFGMCIAWKRQDSLKQFIQQILDHIGGALMIDRTTGLWKLTLIRESENPDSLPSFDYQTGILRIEEDNNSSNDLVTNQMVISYKDPVSNETRTVRTENIASIQRDGIILQNKEYVGLPNAELAGRVASRDMKITQSHLKKFKIVFDRRAYLLQPASAFVLKIPQRGIESIIMRAVRVEHHELSNGEISITAVQDVFGLPKTAYSQIQASLWVKPDFQPLAIEHSRLFELPYTHLLDDFSHEQLQFMQQLGYVMPLAQRPNDIQLDFDVWAKLTTEINEQYTGTGQFIYRGTVQHDVAKIAGLTTLIMDNLDAHLLDVGQCAVLGDGQNDEIVQIQAIDFEKNQLTVKRGCIDTVPQAHPENSSLWAYQDIATVAERAVQTGQTLNLKLLSKTSQGQYDSIKATALSFMPQQRIARPFPPANVKINGLSYPKTINELKNISWLGRNKISQNTTILDQLAPHQTAEDGTTFSLIISKKTNQNGSYQVVAEKHGITGYQIDIIKIGTATDGQLVANLDNAVMIKVELWTIKNGLDSLQRHDVEFEINL